MYVSHLKQAEGKGDEKEDFSELNKCLEDVFITKRTESVDDEGAISDSHLVSPSQVCVATEDFILSSPPEEQRLHLSYL